MLECIYKERICCLVSDPRHNGVSVPIQELRGVCWLPSTSHVMCVWTYGRVYRQPAAVWLWLWRPLLSARSMQMWAWEGDFCCLCSLAGSVWTWGLQKTQQGYLARILIGWKQMSLREGVVTQLTVVFSVWSREHFEPQPHNQTRSPARLSQWLLWLWFEEEAKF